MTTATRDAEALLRAIAADPEGWPLYRIAADAFKEAGDDVTAECLEWAARERKRAWAWWKGDRPCWSGAQCKRALGSELPVALFDALTGRQKVGGGNRYYATPLAALTALLAAWRQARAGGWSPEGGEA